MNNLTESPYCRCGQIESTSNYLLYCQSFHDLRINMFDSLHFVNAINVPITSKLLFFGKSELDKDITIAIFLEVQTYMYTVKPIRF
jgi:hypothetical protein